nr:GPP34 family phosphoprotein [Geodermatophilus amargosae]
MRRQDGRRGSWLLLVDGLIAQGVLGRRRSRILLVNVTRHPVLRPTVREEVLHRMRAAATDGVLEPRTAVLLALAGPAGLVKVVAPQRSDRDHARRRMSTAAQQVPAAAVVKRVLAEMQTAVALAAKAGRTGQGGGGSW